MTDAVYDVNVTEGDAIDYNFPNSLTVGQFTISWRAISQTANYLDYVFSTNGPLIMTPGNGDKSTTLYIIDDGITEGPETFTWLVTQTATVGGFSSSFVTQYNFHISDKDDSPSGPVDDTGLPESDALTSDITEDDHQSFDTDSYRFDPISKAWSIVKNGVVTFTGATRSTAQGIYDYLSDNTSDKIEEFTEDYITDHVPGGQVAFEAWRQTEPGIRFYQSSQSFFDKTWKRLDTAFNAIDPNSTNVNDTFDIEAVENDLKQYTKELIDSRIGYPIVSKFESAVDVMNSVRMWFSHSDISAHLDIDVSESTTSTIGAKPGHRSIGSGSEKNDILRAGDLGDVIYGGGGNDQIFGGAKRDSLLGGAGADVISGSTGSDIIAGGDGNDNIDGGAGFDRMFGGTGNDTFLVDSAQDAVREHAKGGVDTVKASTSYTLATKQEIEILRTSFDKAKTAINLTGNEYVNTVIGNAGANTINGGLGKDTLFGGAGKDTFFFSTKLSAANLDHIKDFKAVDDTIKLENSGSGLFTHLAKGSLHADEFKLITSAKQKVDANDHILYDKAHGALYYDYNGGTSAGRVEFVVLDNHAGLTYKDFLIV